MSCFYVSYTLIAAKRISLRRSEMCIVFYSIPLHCIVPHYGVLQYIVLCCITLYYIVHCTSLQNPNTGPIKRKANLVGQYKICTNFRSLPFFQAIIQQFKRQLNADYENVLRTLAVIFVFSFIVLQGFVLHCIAYYCILLY